MLVIGRRSRLSLLGGPSPQTTRGCFPVSLFLRKPDPHGTIMDFRDGLAGEGAFGPGHIIEPSLEHTHTAIMLHGRGSDGPEFAEELAETAAPGQQPLMQRFPSWRWVFPSSQELWSTAFEEMLPAWFEAHSLTDTTAKEDLQIKGIRQSVAYIQSILTQEAARLGGETEKVVIMGISQGGAIGMWMLLCQGNIDRRFGAFVGTNTWLPFAANIQRLLGKGSEPATAKATSETSSSDGFVGDIMSAWSRPRVAQQSGKSLLSTPVFLGHGVDDAVVDIDLGRQAQHVLGDVGFQVGWKEYLGAELEGHWLKTPEQIDDIDAFLKKATAV